MSPSRTDKYWSRVKYAFAAPVATFLLTIIGFATLPGNVDAAAVTFSTYPIRNSLFWLFILSLFGGVIVLWHSIYRDKQELSKDYPSVNRRHWITIGVFGYFTAGVYPFWYLLARYSKAQTMSNDDEGVISRVIPDTPSKQELKNSVSSTKVANGSDSDVGVVTPSGGGGHGSKQSAGSQTTVQQLVSNAQGDNITAAALSGEAGGVLTLSYLHNEPMQFYLDSGEQPHYLFDNVASGVTLGGQTIKAGWTDSYRNSMLVTSQGIHFFVGRTEGDFHEFEPHHSIKSANHSSGIFTDKFSVRTDSVVYRFSFQSESEDPEPASEYIESQISMAAPNQSDTGGASDDDLGLVIGNQVSPAGQSGHTGTPTGAGAQNTGTGSGPGTDSGITATTAKLKSTEKSLDKGDTLRAKGTNYRDAGEYDRAISVYDDARDLYEQVLSEARQSDLIDASEIEQRLNALANDRQEAHHERITANIEGYHSQFKRADALARDGEIGKSRQHLASLNSSVQSARDDAGQHGFDDLQSELAALESRCAERLTTVTERSKSEPPTDTLPAPPDLSVEYGSLTQKQQIGSGGNAHVTRASHPAPDGDVTIAIKEPQVSGTLLKDQVDRMLTEANTWSKLDDHRHIVSVIDYAGQPVPWIAIEYMDGGHLGERASQMQISQALWTAITITRGVRHAHRRGVAHLDLKPENILFQRVANAWDVPKVADWGLSKHLLDRPSNIEGLSPEYAAPEQFENERGTPDDITDIYQLGAVFYRLFTGRPPFTGNPAAIMDQVLHQDPTPPENIAKLPDELNDILLTAIAKEKSDRYRTVEYLEDSLQNVYDSL